MQQPTGGNARILETMTRYFRFPSDFERMVFLSQVQQGLAIKTAIAALEGKVIPQSIKLPLAVASYPDMKAGQDYFPKQSDNFFVGNSFPSCNINFSAQEIMGQTKENQ